MTDDRIDIRIPPGLKTALEEKIETDDLFNSVSDFIRAAIRTYLSEDVSP